MCIAVGGGRNNNPSMHVQDKKNTAPGPQMTCPASWSPVNQKHPAGIHTNVVVEQWLSRSSFPIPIQVYAVVTVFIELPTRAFRWTNL